MKRRARIISVFGSSLPRVGDERYSQAYELGASLAAKGFVVCCGGYSGAMEAVSRGARDAGGRTIGVTARSFKAHANAWIDEEVSVENWQDRLFELIRRGQGYVACPGGTGTLVELAVVWEMISKGAMKKKPLVVLGGFWQPVIDCMHEAEPVVHTASSPSNAADYLALYFEVPHEVPHIG